MEHVVHLLFLSGLFLFILFFYGYWQSMCIDWGRQLMFEERSKLFDMAADGKIPFQSVEYVTIRCEIEKMIRFLHLVSWQRMLFLHLFRKRLNIPDSQLVIAEILDRMAKGPTRCDLRHICIAVGFAAIVCLMGRSIFLGPIFLALYLLRWLRDNLDNAINWAIFWTVRRDAELHEADRNCSQVKARHTHIAAQET